MSRVEVVTSCSAAGWQEYGARFVESFLHFWPDEIALNVVSEDALPRRAEVMSWELYRASPVAQDFHLRHRDRLRSHGRERMPTDIGWTPKKADRGYNFRYDAYRFAKKVFSIGCVAEMCRADRLFWIDADVVTFAPVPLDLLGEMLPADKALSCLDRGLGYHSECGFVGYNLAHPRCREFIDAFVSLFASDEVFKLAEWHDSWVFDWLRRKMDIPTHAIPHNSRHHPFVNSELGKYMDHLKGVRKTKGKTPTSEVLSGKKRALPYWAGATQ